MIIGKYMMIEERRKALNPTYILSSKAWTWLACLLFQTSLWAGGPSVYYPDEITVAVDTIPISDPYGDHISDPNRNPFDIVPSSVEQKVEYDPESGNYVVFQKIGDEYYRTPTYLTFEEYLDYRKRQQERDYFSQMAGLSTGKKKSLSILDPMQKVDVKTSLIDRLFGGTEVNIQPQGNVDISAGFDYQKVENPQLQQFGQTQRGLDLDMLIRMNVDGNIGEKMKLGFNYDTQSTFNFDQKIKLSYDTEAFSEDDIIKKIEAGNVSLPLRGNLIQGAQSLFGIKTELQFGHLRLTAIASQQRSQQNNIQIESGNELTQIPPIFPDDYDENRHFFISHYNRATYEENLRQLPFIASSFRINRIEVWISDDRTDFQRDTRQVCSVADLAEGWDSLLVSPNGMPDWSPNINPITDRVFFDAQGRPLPDNRVNPAYEALRNTADIEDIDKVSAVLSGDFNRKQTLDFETFQGRLLNSSEYTFHPQLGVISLNQRLRPNQQLAVAYEYYFTENCDEVYQVGQLSDGQTTNVQENEEEPQEPPKTIFVKMIKPANQVPTLPTWDLMMKNVYSLRASNISQQDFEFDIFWQNDRDGSLLKFIDIPNAPIVPLLELFNLDNLNKYQDPQPDGIFDYVPGVTIIERNGSVFFPRLEPFGNDLYQAMTANGVSDSLANVFSYPELYDTTVTAARNLHLDKNKFTMLAKVKNAVNGEIQLGPFIQENSVRVTAGGRTLVEGSDYEIDYSLGRLRIINEAYLQEGVPINVNFEDNAVFSLQQKNMLGLRAQYDFSDNFSLGATYLKLSERPFTQKVNIGDDPIKNRVFGLDMSYSNEASWLTSAVDRLPFYSTKEKSSINFTGEVAALKPGASSAINAPDKDNEAVLNIDDFEGAVSGFLLGTAQSNVWTLASTPPDFTESSLNNSLDYNKNRAKIAWYQLERGNRNGVDVDNPFTRNITQDELFQRDLPTGDNTLYTFDVSYWPQERGPYNFDTDESNMEFVADAEGGSVRFTNPENRWGGIMRYFNNSDFEAANYEFIEFWMLDPYGDRPDQSEQHAPNEEGRMVFNLGNVSEDILKDGRQFFENSINVDPDIVVQTPYTVWGKVPFLPPVVNAFDLERGQQQDVGLDGLTDDEELVNYSAYLAWLNSKGWGNAIKDGDVSADNFKYFDDPSFPDGTNLLERFKDFNNPQGNAPLTNNNAQQQGFTQRRGNPRPEKEDLNNNRSLESGESFYEYEVVMKRGVDGRLDPSASPYIVDTKPVTARNSGQTEYWYRVRIPIQSNPKAVNGISGFRSIQFMRMYLTGFERPKTFRMAEFELVRNQWRKDKDCSIEFTGVDDPLEQIIKDIDFNVDERGVEENSLSQPFNYKIPPGIKQERIFNTYNNIRQDENSLSMNFCELDTLCQVSIYKVANIDLTFYKKLELFTHLESDMMDALQKGDLSLFVKIGKDRTLNYYEYEIPLVPSSMGDQNEENIWPEVNKISLDLDVLTDIKKSRIEANWPFGELYPRRYTASNNQPTTRVIGNPSLGFVKVIEIGVRNTSGEEFNSCGEVWVNELRAKGLKNGGGVAAQARMQMRMADLGEVNLSGNFESVGWGGLDQRIQERSRDQVIAYDAATNLALDKFFPEKWGLQIPFYAQYSRNVRTPKFDPYQQDLSVEEAAALQPDEDVKERARTTTTTKAFNFTNVKKSGKGGKRKIWSPENVSVTYAYSETKKTDPIIQEDNVKEYTGSLDYQYSRRGGYIKPFSFIKSKSLKLFSDFGFNPLPSSVTFSTSLNKQRGFRTFREPVSETTGQSFFRFDDRRFSWDRRYGLKWDLTRNIKVNFDAQTTSIIDELRQVGIRENPDDRPWVNAFGEEANPDTLSQYRSNNIKRLGRNQGYTHNLAVTWNVPFKNIPYMDWVSVKANYKAGYGWDAASLIEVDNNGNNPGNVIRNNQDRSINANLGFEKLYAKSKYLKAIEKGSKANKRRKRSNRRRVATKKGGKDLGDDSTKEGLKEDDGKAKRKEESSGPSMLERVLIRPLLSLRQASLSYKENLSSLIPSLEVTPSLLGLESGFGAPGLGYAFGGQPNVDKSNPNNFLRSAVDDGWVNPSRVLNNELNLDERHDITAKFIIEPFNDFKIDLNFKKNYRKSHREVFKNKGGQDPADFDFMQISQYDLGSFETSYIGLNTLFSDQFEMYKRFMLTRDDVSQVLGKPGSKHENEEYVGFTEGLGPNNPDVAIPAFLYAYENKPIPSNLDVGGLEADLRSRSYIPKPNWSLTYDGLSKLGVFKNIFSNFSLKHAYKSTMTVNNFNTTARYDSGLGFREQAINTDNGNYYSRILIPSLAMREQFSPLLGISVKTKNDMNIDFEYSKSRNMDLRLTSEELSEDSRTEWSFGLGYTIKNFQGFGKKKKKRRSKRKQEADKKDDKKDKSQNRRGRVNNNRGRNLTINCDVSYSDDLTTVYRLSNISEPVPSRGNTTLRINPNVDYVLNDNLTLRFYADYSKTKPKVSNTFPITNFATGITFRFTLN